MLCHTLDGFEEALEQAADLEAALASADVTEVFEMLIAAPLAEVTPPARAQLMMIDALDEIPKEGQKPLLELIAKQLALLPTWLRLFVTSRDEVRALPAASSTLPLAHRAISDRLLSDAHARAADDSEGAERLRAEGAARRRGEEPRRR